MIAVLFRVDATAILLPVEPHGLGCLDPLLPTRPEVIVEELYPIITAQFFTEFANQFVVLVARIEQAGSECIVV
jgi:hypothetical protein